jgi:putative glutamine transport system substrate-binding protein
MKRILTTVLVGALSLGLLAGCGGATPTSKGMVSDAPEIKAIQARGTLKAGVKVDVPKFGYKDPKTEKTDGFEVDLVRAIAKEIIGDATKIDVQGVNATTRGAMLDDGSIDVVVATFTINDDRKTKWNFSDPYFVDNVGFLVNNNGPKTFKELDGKKIGVSKSATTKAAVQKKADADGVKVEFLEFGTYPEIKAALDAKRIDAFSVDQSILLGYKDKNTTLMADKFAPQNYGVATKKSNTALATVVNDIVNKMLKNGEMDTLLKKWELK